MARPARLERATFSFGVRTSWANALISNNPKSPKGRRKP